MDANFFGLTEIRVFFRFYSFFFGFIHLKNKSILAKRWYLDEYNQKNTPISVASWEN